MATGDAKLQVFRDGQWVDWNGDPATAPPTPPGTVTANQGLAGTQPWLVQDQHPDPQLNALTDAQLRASAVPVATGLNPLTDAQLRASAVPVSDGHPDPQLNALTDAQLRASAVPVSGPLTDGQLRASAVPVATGLNPLTDAQLRASAVPVSGPLTDTQLRASAVPVATGLAPLTDAQLRATAVPVSTGLTPLTDTQLRASAVPVSGPLTDTQLRASAVPVSGPLTDAQLRASAVPVSTGLVPLTDAQLRASAVPVSGPLTDGQLRASAVPVSGPLTDTQLRASAVPVSVASLPLPAGAATEASLGTDGSTPPTNSGTGIRGWLRTILDWILKVPRPGQGSTRTSIVRSGTAAGALYTVPAGKTLYITCAWLSGLTTLGLGGGGTAYLWDAISRFALACAIPGATVALAGAGNLGVTFTEPWTFPAGAVVTLGQTNLAAVNGGFTGYIE